MKLRLKTIDDGEIVFKFGARAQLAGNVIEQGAAVRVPERRASPSPMRTQAEPKSRLFIYRSMSVFVSMENVRIDVEVPGQALPVLSRLGSDRTGD